MDNFSVPPLRILVVDDHPLMRSGIIAMLKQEMPCAYLGQGGTLQEALDLLGQGGPWDLLLLDQRLPDGKGIDQLVEVVSKVRVLLLTMFDSKELCQLARQRGASGFVSKGESPRTLLMAIEAVLSGGSWFPDLLDGRDQLLSERERDLLQELLKGRSPTEIACEWGISYSSVQSYKSRLFAKLNVTSIAELTKLAATVGLV